MSNCRSYDCIIAGGGIAGTAAALAAAAGGCKTALLEKTAWWGGLATGGLIYIFLPLDDGMGHQVSFGMAEKLYRAAIKYGPGSIDEKWSESNPDKNPAHPRWRTPFSPAAFILAMDELLEAAGVDLYLDTCVINAEYSDRKINAVEIFTNAGRQILSAPVFIDATGDAALARMANCATVQGCNNLAFWGMQIAEDGTPLPCGNHALSKHFYGVTKGIIDPTPDRYALEDGAASKFLLDSRRYLRKYYQERKVDRQTLYPVLLPTLPQFRCSAHIVSGHTIKEDTHNMCYPDSIGMSADWCNVGIVQEIPFSAMLPQELDNLIAVGRCIDAENYAWDLIRSIPAVAVSGEAAGCAAALCAKNNCTTRELDVNLLQDSIRNNGGKCSMQEINLPYRGEKDYIEPVWLHGNH